MLGTDKDSSKRVPGTLDKIEKLPVLQISGDNSKRVKDMVVRESSLTIVFNNTELITLACSPVDIEYLAVGYLAYRGLIKSKADIKRLKSDGKKGIVRVEAEHTKPVKEKTTPAKITTKTLVSPGEILTLLDRFINHSVTYKETSGVHSAALCDEKEMLLFHEDIGRNNAIDKVFGECILKDIPTEGRLLLTTARVPSEILLKAARRAIPLVISKSAPTNLAVKLAKDLNITIVGFVREKRMRIYSNDWRVIKDDK